MVDRKNGIGCSADVACSGEAKPLLREKNAEILINGIAELYNAIIVLDSMVWSFFDEDKEEKLCPNFDELAKFSFNTIIIEAPRLIDMARKDILELHDKIAEIQYRKQ